VAHLDLGICDHDVMSDEDLWGQQEKPDDRASEDADPSPDHPEPAVGDQTQPITGSPAAGPASSPQPSYQPPSGPGAVPPPTNPYAQHNPSDPHVRQNPYGAAPTTPYPQQGGPGPYGAHGYAPPPNPYPAPNEYGAPQNPYGTPYQAAYAGGGAADHPSATTSMVLGIVALVGIFFCAGLTLVLAPAAWVVGAKAVREIDASPGRYAGRDRAQAGKIMGIIGSVLLVLGVLAIIGLLVVAISVGGGTSDPTPVFQSPSFQSG
jgi:hypothetical protein